MSAPEARFFVSQRLRLHYADWGNPAAPPLILLHGGRDHCRSWDWTAQALRNDWHIIAPDLRGHVPVGYGPGYPQGEFAGEEQHRLLTTEMPMHPHLLMADASTAATSNGGVPTVTTVLGQTIGTQSGGANFNVFIYSNAASNGTMAPQALSNTGGGAPHENRMPYLALNFCIALVGLFPSRN